MPEQSPITDQAEPRPPRFQKSSRLRGRRAVIAMLMVGLWATLLGIWLVFGRPTSWREWLTNMGFWATRSGASDGKVAAPDTAGAKLTYYGDGRAELGQYSIKLFDPITRSTLRTDFHLEGRTVCVGEDAFQEFMKSNHRFFREQVMVTVRNCESDDLADPELQLLEKKLVSRVNRALGRRFLKSAEIKDFFLYESVGDSAFIERDPSDETATP